MGNTKEDILANYVDLEVIEESLGATIDDVTLLKKGHMNNKFILRSDDKNYILKIYKDHRAFISQALSAKYRAQAEYYALQVCQSNDLGAPLPIGLFGNAVLMSKVDATDVTALPLTNDLISLVLSWLSTLHSIEISSNFLGIDVINLHLLAANKTLKRYIASNQDDYLAREVEQLLTHGGLLHSDVLVPLHGDPTLGNWLIDGQQVYGLDFEFFGLGNPHFDVGLLAASTLDEGAFSDVSYELCDHALVQYGQNPMFCFIDIRLGVLCGLILIAVSVPDAKRRQMIFRNAASTVTWLENRKRL